MTFLHRTTASVSLQIESTSSGRQDEGGIVIGRVHRREGHLYVVKVTQVGGEPVDLDLTYKL